MKGSTYYRLHYRPYLAQSSMFSSVYDLEILNLPRLLPFSSSPVQRLMNQRSRHLDVTMLLLPQSMAYSNRINEKKVFCVSLPVMLNAGRWGKGRTGAGFSTVLKGTSEPPSRPLEISVSSPSLTTGRRSTRTGETVESLWFKGFVLFPRWIL